MIETLKDDKGEIKAVIEWWIVDNRGQFDPKGNYIFVNEVDISKSSENNGVLKTFIKIITDKIPYAKYCYFQRRKYDMRIKMYSRRQWLKLIKA